MKTKIHKHLNRIGINPESPLGQTMTEILVVVAQLERERRINRAA